MRSLQQGDLLRPSSSTRGKEVGSPMGLSGMFDQRRQGDAESEMEDKIIKVFDQESRCKYSVLILTRRVHCAAPKEARDRRVQKANSVRVCHRRRASMSKMKAASSDAASYRFCMYCSPARYGCFVLINGFGMSPRRSPGALCCSAFSSLAGISRLSLLELRTMLP